MPTAATTAERVDAELAELEAEGRRLLERSSAVADAFELTYELDLRYRGQAYNLTVPLEPRPVTAATLAVAELAFAAEHERLYDYTPSVTETEIVTLRLRALARTPELDWESSEPAVATAATSRPVFDGAWSEWTVRLRDALRPGDVLGSRTIVEQEDATVAVPAGWRGRVEAGHTLVLHREDAA
jgi:N-methylhydantoinase A